MKRFAQFCVFGCGILLLVGLTGCPFATDPDDKTDPDPVSNFRARTSPENLLYNLRIAYDERDLTEYDSLLAADFTFFLSPDDQHIAERFNRYEELEVHENMFEHELVQTLTLTFDEVGAEDITLDEVKTTPEDSLWTTIIVNVDLLLFGKTPGQAAEEAPQGYQLEDGQEQFWFRKNSWTNSEGDPIWTIVEWQELGTGK